MKQILILTALILNTVIATSQVNSTFSANEMLAIVNCDDYDCFNDRIQEKGYSLKFTEEKNDIKTYDYSSDAVVENKSNPNIVMRYKAGINQHLTKNNMSFSHTVVSEFQYKKLLNEFKENGFKYVKTDRVLSEYSNTALFYECEEYPEMDLIIAIFVKEHNGQEYKEYKFILDRPVAEKEE